MKAYNSTYIYNFICLSEKYLDSSIPDSLLNIEGYNVVRADHPDNIKRGGVCIYYKEYLPIRVISLSYINETILLEMDYNNDVLQQCFPNQNNHKWLFLTNFQKILNKISNHKPSLSIMTGDFNARSYIGDVKKLIPQKDQNYLRDFLEWFFSINKWTNTSKQTILHVLI